MRNLDYLKLTERSGMMVLPVKAVAGSSRDRIAGILGDRIKVTVAAPPEKGKANKASAALLAELLGAPRRDVLLLTGASSPLKEFGVRGLTMEEVLEALRRL